jgi:hypothetical protein
MRGFGSAPVGGNWGPPALNGDMLRYNDQMARQGGNNLAGMLGGALGGALQKDPTTGGRGGWAGAWEGAAEAASDEYKRLKDAGRAADFFMKSLGDEGWKQLGMPPEQFDTMGARDKSRAVAGLLKAQAVREVMEGLTIKREEANRRESTWQQEQADRGRMQAFNRNVQDFMQPVAGTGPLFGALADPALQQLMGPQTPTGQDLMGLAAKAGVLEPRTAMSWAENQVDWGNKRPREFSTANGLRLVYGAGGQFQFDPSQFLEGGLQQIPVMDESGEVVGHRVRTGATSTAPMPKPKGARVLPESFFSRYQELQQDLRDLERMSKLPDAELKKRGHADPAAKRAEATTQLDEARKALEDHFGVYQSQGYGDEGFWRERYAKHGLEGGKPAPAEGAGTERKAINTEALLKEANDAIQKGANPEAVKKRLAEKYGIRVQ